MSDREPTHPTPPAATQAPASTTTGPKTRDTLEGGATSTDLVPPAIPTDHQQPIPEEEREQLDLVDWDEEDIEGADLEDDGSGSPDLLEIDRPAPTAGFSTTGEHLRPSASVAMATAAARSDGEARAELQKTEARADLKKTGDGSAHSAIDEATASKPPPAMSVPDAAAKDATAATGKVPQPKLKSVLVWPDRPGDVASLAGKQTWQRRQDLKMVSTAGSYPLPAHGSKQPTAQVEYGHQSGTARSWEEGQPSGSNDMQSELQAEPLSPKWQPAKKKRHERHNSIPEPAAMAEQVKRREAARAAFKKKLAGRCFRCLAPNHFLAQCREPVRCWECNGVGHFSRDCPSRRRVPSAALRARLKFPPENIHSRIHFPPLITHPPPQQNINLPPPPEQHNTPPPPPPPIHKSTAAPLPSVTPEAMAYVPSHAPQRQARGHVNIVSTAGVRAEANRLRMCAIIVSAPQEGFRANSLELSYALWGQLRIPRHNIAVSRYGPGRFLAVFSSAAERDRAATRGFVEIGGAAFPFTPWRSAGGVEESIWYYHVKVVMENVPREAWNEEGVKLILGDPCIVDRIERTPGPGDNSDLLTCWVWMEDPDQLPRSLSYTFFAYRAGQAVVVSGLEPAPSRIPARPPVGLEGSRVMLIHLAGYEDWSPSSDSGSGTSSEHGSSGVAFIPFDWECGVLDGRQEQEPRGRRNDGQEQDWRAQQEARQDQGRRVHPGGCRPPPSAFVRRHDHDDSSRGPGPRDDRQRSTRVRQLFPGCASERSVRVRTRSPPSYRQALMGGTETLERGRASYRSPPQSRWGRDVVEHTTEDWERRRSRSPPSRPFGRNRFLMQEADFEDPLAQGQEAIFQSVGGFDPMIQESQGQSPPYSPDGDEFRMASPEYVPVSDTFVRRSPTSAAGGGDTGPQEILFGPGVQLPAQHQVEDIADQVTRMEIDGRSGAGLAVDSAEEDAIADDADVGFGLTKEAELEEEGAEDAVYEEGAEDAVYDDDVQNDDVVPSAGCAAFCRGIFKEPPAPLLPRPPVPHHNTKTKKQAPVTRRTSLRQAAHPSPVPVAERAQRKLMRELKFMENHSGPTDAAVTEYIASYGQDLEAEAIQSIRTAARLGERQLARVLAAVAAEAGMHGMEVH